MNRKIIIGILAILITGLIVAPSMAKGPSGKAGLSKIGHLYLYEKAPDPELTRDDPWLIVEDGMWGKMKYDISGPTFDFVFNGHGLPIGQSYTLIYYPDPWPAAGLICLGSGIVTACEGEEEELCIYDGTGNIHIKGSVDTGDLPIDSDDNHADNGGEGGAKIFLVPSGDVDCENQLMVGWSGDDANLYEGTLITFHDTDGITDMPEGPGYRGPSGRAGKSNIGHLYLYEKTPDPELTRDDPWLIVEGGMWGKMKYNISGPTFDFVFNGHNLPIGQSYALIYYPDPWPGAGLICLGSGVVTACEEELCSDDGTGNIHIKGSVDTGDLPIDSDDNHADNGGAGGAKIFLVPLGDVDCGNQVMVGWSGDDANLYEGALITFDYTDED